MCAGLEELIHWLCLHQGRSQVVHSGGRVESVDELQTALPWPTGAVIESSLLELRSETNDFVADFGSVVALVHVLAGLHREDSAHSTVTTLTLLRLLLWHRCLLLLLLLLCKALRYTKRNSKQ